MNAPRLDTLARTLATTQRRHVLKAAAVERRLRLGGPRSARGGGGHSGALQRAEMYGSREVLRHL